MSSREAILTKLWAHSVGEAAAGAVTAEPSPVSVDSSAQLERFAALAAATQMTVSAVADAAEAAAAISSYLQSEKLGTDIVLDGTLGLSSAECSAAGLRVSGGDARADGDVYVASSYGALAECGAVIVASAADRALRNDFLAATHILVVAAERLLPGFSDLWSLLRAERAAGDLRREYCLVTGPSRTADLGVPAKLGAHGPARVHVIVVADASVAGCY